MALQMNTTITLTYTNDMVKYDENFKLNFPTVKESIVQTININNAYYMIDKIEGSKEELTIVLNMYKDSSKSWLIKVDTYKFIPSVANDSPDFIRQGYNHLKSLDEFSNAIDILEEGQVA